jgi:hypothetical protein
VNAFAWMSIQCVGFSDADDMVSSESCLKTRLLHWLCLCVCANVLVYLALFKAVELIVLLPQSNGSSVYLIA